MILIQAFKKIKRQSWYKEITVDIIFYCFCIGYIYFVISSNLQNSIQAPLLITEVVEIDTVVSDDANNNQKYTASSRGKYFYENGSDRANSLSEKNKIYFSTAEEAKNAGFKPYIGI